MSSSRLLNFVEPISNSEACCQLGLPFKHWHEASSDGGSFAVAAGPFHSARGAVLLSTLTVRIMMNRAGWNPTRRNRNIGTPKQGYGQNNRLVIPNSWHDTVLHYERLGRHRSVRRMVDGQFWTFIVAETLQGWVHACTLDDLVRMLRYIPLADVEGLQRIVLRQPTRKERILNPCWGRIGYMAEVDGRMEPTIFLDATERTVEWKHTRSLKPHDAQEIERLRWAGHKFKQQHRSFVINSDVESVRATQLYVTLSHEVGHWVDWLETVLRPGDEASDDEWDRLIARYSSRPQQERESCAHRYSDEIRSELIRRERIPFERIVDTEQIDEDGLNVEDFVSEHQP